MVKKLPSPLTILYLMCGLVSLSGCDGGREQSTIDNTPVIQVDYKVYNEKVHHQRFESCWKVLVFADGSYKLRDVAIWSDPPVEDLSEGKLPLDLFNDLKDSILSYESKKTGTFTRGWRIVNGTQVYEYYLDDSKTKHPVPIENLMDFLMD